MLETTRPRGRYLALIVISIAVSVVSLGALLFRPEASAGWRTPLNIIAMLFVVAAVTMRARHTNRSAN